MKRVVMTGAAGNVAAQIIPLLRNIYPHLVLTDRVKPINLTDNDCFVEAELDDLQRVEETIRGAEGIIHLGGHSVEGPWGTILESNIAGCFNLFEAARRQRVKRVVFASSNHTVGFHERSNTIGIEERVRPDSRYGVSKAFGEALGSLYADKYGVGVFSIRIGNVADKPADLRRLSIWIHPEDLVQLIRIGLEHPEMRNEVVYGVSGADRSWWDNRNAQRLGYRPRHQSETHLAYAMAEQGKLPADPVTDRFQGGGFCAQEFEGGPADWTQKTISKETNNQKNSDKNS